MEHPAKSLRAASESYPLLLGKGLLPLLLSPAVAGDGAASPRANYLRRAEVGTS
ncbi:MAG TPA: hypothetical protein VGX24_08740 [Pyrinomonadaceae bacterium]|nr:hypothetical protein [Pyrinomonadaceae bacterium]